MKTKRKQTKEKKGTFKEGLAWVKKHFRLRNDIITGKVFVMRRSSKTDEKEYSRGYMMERFAAAKKEYNANTIRAVLAAWSPTAFNAFKERFLNPNVFESYSSRTNPFVKLEHFVELDGDHPFEFAKALENHMVRAAKCALDGQINKYVFTLLSDKQNVGKTHFVDWLMSPVPGEFTMGSLPRSVTKIDQVLASKFIVNVDELEGVDNTDSARFKAITSQSVCTMFNAFKQTSETRPRLATFFATKNTKLDRGRSAFKGGGTSRFIAFKIKSIDFSYESAIDPLALWSWAFRRAQREGDESYPSIEEIRAQEAFNRRFQEQPKPRKRRRTRPNAVNTVAVTAAVGAFMFTPWGRALIAAITTIARTAFN